jgi:hypothetical protein
MGNPRLVEEVSCWRCNQFKAAERLLARSEAFVDVASVRQPLVSNASHIAASGRSKVCCCGENIADPEAI